jgi:ATP citrate (pro-S)-lyase
MWQCLHFYVISHACDFGMRVQVALNLDLAGVEDFVTERLGKEVEMGGTRGPITTFIVEPFIPHRDEYYLSIVSDRLGVNFSFSECGGIDIEENWDKV